jgi:HlyD family secretion protein
MTGGRGRAGGVTTGRVWLPDPDSELPRPITMRLGLTDGSYTEVMSGEVQEGAEVIVGVASDAAKTRPQAQQKSGPRFGF